MRNPAEKNHIHGRQFGLDFVRAAAIALVLLSHFAKTLDYLGFWGVELFFGLSGYLIGQILWRSFSESGAWSGPHIVNFWARRWWRTLPSYYLFFFVTFLIDYVFSQPLPSIGVLAKFLWFGQSFAKHYSWFYGVSWSLCIEEWFYLIFPLLLLAGTFFGLRERVAFSLAIVVMFVGCFIARQLLVQDGAGEDLRVITIGRLDAIASGVFVAYCMSIFEVTKRQKTLLMILGVIVMLATILIPYWMDMSFEMIKGNPYLLLSAPVGGALILPYCSLIRRPTGLFSVFSNGIERISLWSYSIYLCHMPVLITIYNIQHNLGLDDFRGSTVGNIATKTIGVVFIIAISAFLFKYFESPLTRRRPAELRYRLKQVEV